MKYERELCEVDIGEKLLCTNVRGKQSFCRLYNEILNCEAGGETGEIHIAVFERNKHTDLLFNGKILDVLQKLGCV